MIELGERISVETLDLGEQGRRPDRIVNRITALDHVIEAKYDGRELAVRCTRGEHNLIDILGILESENVSIGHLTSRPPTLNDVFLELTGTALRD